MSEEVHKYLLVLVGGQDDDSTCSDQIIIADMGHLFFFKRASASV